MRFKIILNLLEQTGKDFTKWIDGEYIDTQNLLQQAEKWSSGERALIDLALSLYSYDHKINLRDIFQTLDKDNTAHALKALQDYNS